MGQATLLTGLASRDAHPFRIFLVWKLYSGCSTVFSLSGHSDGIRVSLRCGIKQGDPLSPFLYNTVTDRLLCALHSGGLGGLVGDLRLAATDYADDLVVVSDTFAGLLE